MRGENYKGAGNRRLIDRSAVNIKFVQITISLPIRTRGGASSCRFELITELAGVAGGVNDFLPENFYCTVFLKTVRKFFACQSRSK